MRSLSIATLAVVVAVSSFPRAASAQVVSPGHFDCSTPRRALSTWLSNLQEGEEHPSEAVRCFDWDGARVTEREERVDRARRLKRVLDARGLYVELEDISDEASPADVTRVVPFPNLLAGFAVTKRGSDWLVSAETIRSVPVWYDETFALDLEHVVGALPAWTHETALGAAWWQWIALPILIVIALIVRQLVSFIVQTQGTRLLTTLVRRLSPALLKRAALPIGTTVATILLMYAFPSLRFGVDVNRVVIFALRVATAVSAVLIVYRLVDVAADVLDKRADETSTKLDDQLVPLIRKSLKVVTVVLGVIFVLQNLEVDVASLIAGVSLGGLAFTLAARDTVANLFGSLSIFADQPFQVGDWVVMQGVEGVVEEVGMRSTRVRTFYRSVVSIPNAKVADGIVDNYGARDSRRTSITLGLQYDTTPEQMEAFCDGVRAILAANPAVKKDAYHVYFSGFGDSALNVMLYFFFVVDDWKDELRQRHLVFLEILRLASALRVQFAFPTRTLHVATRAREADVALPEPPSDAELGAAVLAFGPGGELARPGGPAISHGFYPAPPPELTPPREGDDPSDDEADRREA